MIFLAYMCFLLYLCSVKWCVYALLYVHSEIENNNKE